MRLRSLTFAVASPVRGAASRAVFLLGILAAAGAAFANGSDGVVVLANGNVPESVDLARYYLRVRGIPTNHLCVLDLPAGEVISRTWFEVRLRDPLLEFLREQNLVEQVRRDPKTVDRHESAWTTLSSSVRYLVSMFGVPVRISDSRLAPIRILQNRLHQIGQVDAAAVDSELAVLLLPAYGIGGAKPNPIYNQLTWDEAEPTARLFLVAARLDGPDAATARRLLDDALAAERYGLQGRAYFDGRGLREGNYLRGDYWIREACDRFEREGYECVRDENDPLWGVAFPMEDAAVYLGWYLDHLAGVFSRTGFSFRPGAVAYHLHSSSAEQLRTRTAFWAGPLLSIGAAATMGAVNEPYLNFTPHLDLFADRLCRGHTFGESAWEAISVVSWQISVVGDPLYRPFRHKLEDQTRHLEEDGRPEVDWAYLREVNRMVRSGRFNVALDRLRERLKKRDSPVLREKLGDLLAKNELFSEAGEQYRQVVETAGTAETAVRVGARWTLMLRLLGRGGEAEKIEEGIRQRWKDHPVLPWLDTSRL
jgi:uncharacterized protein (TIGR03790 family)